MKRKRGSVKKTKLRDRKFHLDREEIALHAAVSLAAAKDLCRLAMKHLETPRPLALEPEQAGRT